MSQISPNGDLNPPLTQKRCLFACLQPSSAFSIAKIKPPACMQFSLIHVVTKTEEEDTVPILDLSARINDSLSM